MDRNAPNDQERHSGLTVWTEQDIDFFYCCCLQEVDMLYWEISWAAYWPITGGLLWPIALLLNCGRGRKARPSQ